MTPLERALHRLPLPEALESLELVEKLTRDVLRSPGDMTLRRIRVGNPRVAAVIKEMGWVQDGDTMVLPFSACINCEKEIVAVIAAKNYYRKEKENERQCETATPKAPLGNRASLVRRMVAGGKERETNCSTTKARIAQKLSACLGIGKGNGV